MSSSPSLLHFSQDCSFLHRLPKLALADSAKDIFGREKHSEYRDDMGGVGSFHRINRTLYVGKIKEGRDTAGVIERHFEEFGDIERSPFSPSPPNRCVCSFLSPSSNSHFEGCRLCHVRVGAVGAIRQGGHDVSISRRR